MIAIMLIRQQEGLGGAFVLMAVVGDYQRRKRLYTRFDSGLHECFAD